MGKMLKRREMKQIMIIKLDMPVDMQTIQSLKAQIEPLRNRFDFMVLDKGADCKIIGERKTKRKIRYRS
jgi:hypothetical protein